MFASCRLCGKSLDQVKGYLERDLPKVMPATWTCRPLCDAELTPDQAVIAAIEEPKTTLKNWPFPT